MMRPLVTRLGGRLTLFARILRLCYRARPTATVVIVLLMACQAVAAAVLALAQGTLVDHAVQGLGPQVIAAIGVGAVVYVLAHVGVRTQFSLRYDVAEAVELTLTDDLIRWTTRSATIDHLHDQEYLDRLTVVLRKSQTLAYATWALLAAVTAVVALTTSLVVLARIHPVLMLLALFAVPALFLAGRAGDLYMHALDNNAQLLRIEEQLNTVATSADSLKELLVSGNGHRIDQSTSQLWREMVAEELRARRMAVILTGLGWLIFACGAVLAGWWVCGLVAHGVATVGDVAVVLTLSLSLADQLMDVLMFRLQVAEAGGITDHYLWLRDRSEQLPTPVTPLPAIKRELVLDDVCFTYPGTARPALSAISVTIPAGTVVGLVGGNGAGKSTLTKVLSGLYQPTSGQLRIDGRPVEPGELTLGVSGVFQDYYDFQVLAQESVGVGDLDQADDIGALELVARRSRADEVIDALPERWRTQLGMVFDGVPLSTGQWQRLALARGLLKPQPVLLVFDEPTAAVDPQAEHDLFEAFAQHARAVAQRNGAITILVSHRFSTVTMTDVILVVEDGQLVEHGSHPELMARDGRYRALYEIQARGYAESPTRTPT